ncbi:GntR family transcriptional regulator, vanillate catabolism transcriptional regulator [Marinospirillum alkaliphilum DSM 21637]|uniref:GntR family transcriptional regulator, vanillate catabolism transcriptional regulator n=2 Tax=Marinospirillum TaxID=64968 RepID=A0A1K1W4G0_9GAMM|nr:GntR family transcriptional regulator, vanillate catabolism transcriptional regulator [Marinospirillum alkaliphilum DSM 21637]
MSGVSKVAVSTLRKLISDGHLKPGEKLGEVQVAEMLGVSRTPIRLAFRTLEQEGLLEKAGKQGFVVRAFSREDVICGLEIRGVLEGLAARKMAEAGLTVTDKAALQQCIDDGDALFAKEHPTEVDLLNWSEINARFHGVIVKGAGSRAIADAIARNSHLPFASSDSIIFDTRHVDREFRKLHLAHLQHQMVFQALVMGEGARAEMLMREHAYIGLRYGGLFGLPEALES